MDNKTLGELGEQVAINYLKEKGYKILTTNYFCYCGELDIIADFENAVIFIEVKTRRSVRFGWPEEAVTKEKKEKMRRTAENFLNQRKITDKDFYFDVVSVLAGSNGEVLEIKHLKNI